MIVANWRVLSAAVTSYGALREHLAATMAPPARTELPAPKPRLSVRQVAVAGAGARAARRCSGVSFEASPARSIGVIGPSGAGKTTLLQVIAERPDRDQGEVQASTARATPTGTRSAWAATSATCRRNSALFPGSDQGQHLALRPLDRRRSADRRGRLAIDAAQGRGDARADPDPAARLRHAAGAARPRAYRPASSSGSPWPGRSTASRSSMCSTSPIPTPTPRARPRCCG